MKWRNSVRFPSGVIMAASILRLCSSCSQELTSNGPIDVATLVKLWPHIAAALKWIDVHGDFDGDGFVEYGRKSDNGLVNQGWKDSHDSIFHADGVLAEGPIALVEVQGYVYAAKRAAASIARRTGLDGSAALLDQQAATLQTRF